jgi:hypothetical protein
MNEKLKLISGEICCNEIDNENIIRI